MKYLRILLVVGLFVVLWSIIGLGAPPNFCPQICGPFECPSHLGCSPSNNRIQGWCCCTGSQHGETFCCWYRGVGYQCKGSSQWCIKYLKGACDAQNFYDYEFGMCARNYQHDLVCVDL